jgi:release factor H-coupled RctB family protein
MPTRITIISNANQTLRATFLLPSPALPPIFKAATNKLRLKKPSRLFLSGGTEIPDEATLGRYLQNGVEFHVSCGEDFIGIKKMDVAAGERADVDVKVLAKESYVDPVSVTQLKATAGMRGMIRVVGMPDLHPGLKFPVGAAFVTEGWIHPPLIGGDIGCGMAVFRIPALRARDVDSESDIRKLAERLVGIEGAWPEGEGDVQTFLSGYLSPREIAQVAKWESSLGTIGGGNHFAELQQITTSTTTDFTVDEVVLVVHSGSRGLGKQILEESEEEYEADSAWGREYLRKHDVACRWAKANRDLIALRFLRRLVNKPALSIDEITPHKILDIWHNNIEPGQDGTFIHRKGAAPSTTNLVIIPGSRGTLSAYVKPIPTAATAYSLAHGAGRAQSRTAVHKKLAKRYKPDELRRTKLEGWVVCEDRELIYEEAPEGYKEIEPVIQDLVEEGACEVVAWGMPRISYKVRME